MRHVHGGDEGDKRGKGRKEEEERWPGSGTRSRSSEACSVLECVVDTGEELSSTRQMCGSTIPFSSSSTLFK